MTQKPHFAPYPDLATAGDPELIQLVRGGDMVAYETLFERHHDVALRVAARVAGPERADDVCAEAFAKILDLLMRGKGPEAAFRPYLLATVRTVHLNVIRAGRRESVVSDDDLVGLAQPVLEDVEARFDESAIARAFRQLPERWQSVLWMTSVEGLANEEASQALGIHVNAVSSLAFRARAGLRQAYLGEHLQDGLADDCRRTLDLLPRYLRGTLATRRRTVVARHLDSCSRCSVASVELADVDRRLGALLGPLVVGGGTAAALWPTTAGIAAAPVGAGVLAGHGSGFLGTLTAGFGMSATKVAVAASVAAAGLGVGTHELLAREHQHDPRVPSVVAPLETRAAKAAPTRRPTSHPRPGIQVSSPPPAPTRSVAPRPTATPSATPSAPAARAMAVEGVHEEPVKRSGMTWRRVSVPVKEAPEGTRLRVTSNRTMASQLALPPESGWKCHMLLPVWAVFDYLALTTTDCVYDGHGNGQPVTIDYLLAPNAEVRGVLTPPDGVQDSSLLDNVADLLIS